MTLVGDQIAQHFEHAGILFARSLYLRKQAAAPENRLFAGKLDSLTDDFGSEIKP
jgi:hypothetical protein